MFKFFKILSLFMFCLKVLYNGNMITGNYKISTFKDIWQYCKKWEEGTL